VPGELDGVMLAHGIARGGLIEELAGEDVRNVLDVNLVSLFVILKAASPKLRPGASVVVISSTAAFDHSPVCGFHYTASKWALNGMVRHLAFEWGARNIRINSVCPGYVNNPMGRAFLPVEQVPEALPDIPLGREAEPGEVADVVCWLLGPTATYVTGVQLPVAGGYR
jgi:3alpha(or 20beta)-hydroxysteroid dehydrogenase